ncbi:MAG: EamA family transporter [Burkholderiaceae bacterium]|nr:EamA family transporter [Burkholderiaceae bacterium]
MHPKIQVLLSMLIFSTVGLTVRFVEMPSAVVVLARAVLGTLFMLGFVYLTGKVINKESIRANAKVLIASGIALGLNWMLLFEAFSHTTIAVAVLCYYLAPVFVIVGSPFILKERITGLQLGCVLGALLGMVFVSGFIDGELRGFWGIVLAMSAAVFYASVMFLNKFVKGVSTYDSTVMQLGSAALVFIPYALLTVDFTSLEWTSKGLMLLVVLGVVHTGVAYALFFGSFTKLPAQTISIYSYVDPLMSVLLSWLVLQEPLGWTGFVGALLILGSTLASELFASKK